MAAPHVTGAAALLVQLHPGWSAQQVKSALMSTAAPAWADTARLHEAPVTLGGAGLVDLPSAAQPVLFTQPSSLSYADLDVNHGSDSKALLVRVTDAGGGAGTWQVALAPQAATAGASLDVPAALTVAPGGEADLVAVARARADAAAGEDYGFILLRRGEVTRKIPYEFFVGRPQVALMPAKKLVRFQLGDTINGTNRITSYCCPAAPFGPSPDYLGPAMDESGAETTYVTSISQPVANLGVAIESATAGSLVDPWFLGSPNERDVQGYAGTPVNVNELLVDFGIDLGAAGSSFPKVQRFYVTVDSASDPFTHRSLPGRYVLRSWVNDVRPPRLRLLTRRVAKGRPTIVAHVTDAGAGVDPLSLVIAYRGVLVGAALYDPTSGIAIFPLPPQAAKFPGGRTRAVLSASDFQESKNVNGVGDNILPNTTFRPVSITGVSGPAVTWVSPAENQCVSKTVSLVVVAGSTKPVRSVRFLVDGKQIASDRRGAADVYTGTWQTRFAPPGRHRLAAVATDSAGAHVLGEAQPESLPLTRTAVVTGASSGIGAALVRALAQQGWLTVSLARREDRLRAPRSRRRRRVRGVRRWVTRRRRARRRNRDGASPADPAAGEQRRHSRPEGFHGDRSRAAGGGAARELPRRRCGACAHSCPRWRPLAARTSSTSSPSRARSPIGPAGPYSASKHALLAFSRSTTSELRSRGVHVHTVNPGFVETEGLPAGDLPAERVAAPARRRPRACRAARHKGDRARQARDLRAGLVPRRRARTGGHAVA